MAAEEVDRVDCMKQRYYCELSKSRGVAAKNSVFLTDEHYEQLVNQVVNAKSEEKKSPRDYWLLKRYDILVVQNKNKLIFPVKDESNAVLYYIRDSEIFDVLQTTHASIGHGGRDRMVKEISTKYKNVTRHDIQMFLELCEPCQQKQKNPKKGVVVKPLIFSEFNSRCQVDLIDFQSHPDGKYKFIMVYQDHLTKFVILKKLESKRAEEVAYNLIEIFTLIGAPAVLQSDNGREFANQIVSNLRTFWPELKIVHGKPRHSQSQGSVERANQDIEHMLTTWMQDQKNSHWSEGLQFVQLMKNRAYHAGIKRSPYEAMFGCKIKIGLNTSNLPQDVLKHIENEEQLENVVDSVGYVDDPKENSTKEAQEQASSSDKGKCIACLKESSGAHQCHDCGNEIHAICGIKFGETEGYGAQVLCSLCSKKRNVNCEREEARNSLMQQAKRMKSSSDKRHPPAEVGSTVRVPVPDVDRGRGDAHNILAVVMDVTNDGFCRLGTRDGILKQLYSRSQFSICKQNLLSLEEVKQDIEVSLRRVATQQSTGTGQGFVKCSCKTKCQSKKCFCVKNNVLCNSKCHSSLPCCNK